MERLSKAPPIIFIAIAGLAALQLALCSLVTVEDAFISLRYARNLAEGGGPVFNLGEPVNAMTAPLHVFLMTPFFWMVDDPMFFNKLLGAAAGVTSAIIVAGAFRENSKIASFVFAAALLPAPLMFWSVAGLETPFLALIVAAAVRLVPKAAEGNDRAYLNLCMIAGVAFLFRYNSAVFFSPVLLAIGLRNFSLSKVRAWIAGGAAPIVWLAFCWWYYHDFLPTSFYVKTPDLDLGQIEGNLEYIITFLFVTGLGPITLVLLFFGLRFHRGKGLGISSWTLVLGLLAVILYGLTMARTHMMFQMRFFAPYFSVVAFLCGLLAVRHRLAPRFLIGATVLIAFGSAASLARIHLVSVNGFARKAEYRNLSAPEYANFISALEKNASDIATHWASRGMDRQLRLFTFAEGVVPFRLPESYVFGTLVSYRHNLTGEVRAQLSKSSDYIHMLAPRHGPVEDQLRLNPEATLVSEVQITFDGRNERFLVFWNPKPQDNPLPNRIDGDLPTSGW